MTSHPRQPQATFLERLYSASRNRDSLLCLGLDPDPALMPALGVAAFNRALIEATADLVCAYKPNLAFYEALGQEGYQALLETLEAIPEDIPVIGDAKRGDVGHTARAYARALFEVWGFDAVTVNPYLGSDALEPFLSYRDRGIFLLCKTSNPGSRDFQDLLVDWGGGLPLYEVVARRAQEWNVNGNLGLVVGATYPQELRRIREICPEMPILIPGIGAQGGDLSWAVREGVDKQGDRAIISVSRQVLYASRGPAFAYRAREEALRLREEINRHREGMRAGD